jgi:uncharacterized membrane protein YgdD (TMEM256/DUF423 family)
MQASLHRSRLIALAWILGGIAVVLGAIGSHAVDSPQAKDWIRLASQFQLIHALAIVLSLHVFDRPRWTAYAFFLGIAFFCGGLYGLSFTSLEIFRKITPFGGICLIIGWFGSAAISVRKSF